MSFNVLFLGINFGATTTENLHGSHYLIAQYTNDLLSLRKAMEYKESVMCQKVSDHEKNRIYGNQYCSLVLKNSGGASELYYT